jgi:hypothetical protein
MNNFLRSFQIILISSNIALGQQVQSSTQIESLDVKQVNLGYMSVSVTFADSLDVLPDIVSAHGIIEGITSVPAGCGVMCWWGTALIHLRSHPIGYPHDTIYAAVLCLWSKDSLYMGKTINAEMTKLQKSDLTESCGGVFNRFDSHGVPFYRFIKADALRIEH